MKAYIFQAALLCEDCGESRLAATRAAGIEVTDDNDRFPQGPYSDGGGKADCPQHCDHCGVFLKNPLIDDGRAYVKEAITKARVSVLHDLSRPIAEWAPFYSIDTD